MKSTLARKFRKHGIWMGFISALIVATMMVTVGCSSNPVTPTTPDIIVDDGGGTPNDSIMSDEEEPLAR